MKLSYIGLMLNQDEDLQHSKIKKGAEFEAFFKEFLLNPNKNLDTSGDEFGFHNRFIGNYLSRKLKESKVETINIKRIILIGYLNEFNEDSLFESSLRIFVPFNKVQYDILKKDELPDFFIEMYKTGIIKASQTHEVPVEFLLTKLVEFKENNYKNEWEFKSKTFKEIGIKATLFCKMTMDFFSLTLVLTKKNEVVFTKEILNTLPDEIIYHWQFKDIILENNEIKVLNEFKDPIYTLDLSFKV